jgi:hypothetical protein
MIMRKKTLLIAVAAAALAVGSGTAFSQGMQGGHKSDSPAVQSNPASKNAPAEKIQGQGDHRGAKETTGQGASERGQKMGQDSKEPKGHKSTTGQAPSEPKSGQANERRDNKMDQDHKGNKTTGQAPSQTTPKSDRANEQNRTNERNANERNERNERNANERNERNEPNRAGQNERGGNQNRTGANENRGGGSTNVNVNLTTEQRTKIHSIIVSERSAPRVAHVDFDVHVGTVVPRGKVKLVALPTTIVEIEPSWRGFEYFLVGEEIVVVDPATLRIVAVLPA